MLKEQDNSLSASDNAPDRILRKAAANPAITAHFGPFSEIRNFLTTSLDEVLAAIPILPNDFTAKRRRCAACGSAEKNAALSPKKLPQSETIAYEKKEAIQ